MSNFLSYKGFVGSVEVSLESKCLFGRILGISDLVLYEGQTVEELEKDFRFMVDDYLADLEAFGDPIPYLDTHYSCDDEPVAVAL